MAELNVVQWIFISAAAGFLWLISYFWINMNWGASKEEVSQTMPGDELVRSPRSYTTRAVTIDERPEKIWPWIIQMGYQRAGWYNYDFINGWMGAAEFVDGSHSSRRIVPELQDLKEGDTLFLFPGAGYRVYSLIAPKAMVLNTNEEIQATWVYVLNPIAADKTRMVVRQRAAFENWIYYPFFTIGSLLQERKHLLGIKARAEGRKLLPVTPAE